jgi:arylsulfatase A-like enzyme
VLRLVVALLALLTGCRTAPERPPDLVVISIDTLSRGALRAFEPSAPEHPQLDAFAREALRFQNAVTSAPWTLPAHASLITGLYPNRHGATDPRVKILPDAPTLAQALAATGYETIALTDGVLVGRSYGFARGFDRYDAFVRAPGPGAPVLPRDGKPMKMNGKNLFDRAIAFLEQRPKSARPLFLFLHSYAVHDYFELHPWAAQGLAPERTQYQLLDCLDGTARCDAASWDLLRELYRREVDHFDAGFGRLREAMARAGYDATAVVFVLSDHGEGLDPARGRIGHGGRVSEDLIRIPLLVHLPDRRGRDVVEPVSMVDLMPTLLELAGSLSPQGLDGRSFAPFLRGNARAAAPRTLVAMDHAWLWKDGRRELAPEIQPLPLSIALIRGDRWYLHTDSHDELYDLASDPHQARDLAPGARDRDAWQRELAQYTSERPTTPLRDPDAQLEEKLRALGYAR